MSGRQARETSSVTPITLHHSHYHLNHSLPTVEKWSSMKPVPVAPKLGDHCRKALKLFMVTSASHDSQKVSANIDYTSPPSLKSYIVLTFPPTSAESVVFQLLSHVQLFANPWNSESQAFLSFTLSQVCSNSCPLYWWCHPTISSSTIHFSICPSSFPASGSFPKSWLFTLGGQSIGALVSTLVLSEICFPGYNPHVAPNKTSPTGFMLCFFKEK